MTTSPELQSTPRRLRLVVLLSGTATMALQMSAVRLLGPWVGSSSLVWATIIGLSLLAMSLGYVLGGRLADRRTDGPTLARTIGAAALLVALIPLVAPTLLPHAHLGIDSPGWTEVIGCSVAFVVLFLAPALLLGVTPPYAIRLALTHVRAAGNTAGRLYALSTVGSIIGTLATSLVLVQWIGTRATLLTIAALLLAAALVARTVRPVHATALPYAAADPQHAATDGEQPAAGAVIPLVLAGAIIVVEGMAMMATEMSISRLIAPFFGASHAVWAIIIATVMGSIALGSRLGGRAADRWPTLPALLTLLACASAAVAALPFVATPVMRISTGGIDEVAIGTVVGAFLATMLLLIIPVTLLGMVPPWLLRLSIPDVARAGQTAGRMYALSTAGALVGTFGSVLVLIPAIGTRRTMLLVAGVLALLTTIVALRHVARSGSTAIVSTRARTRAAALPVAAVLLIAALTLAPTGIVKPLDEGRVLEERESRYQYIQVVEEETGARAGRRVLQLNEGWAVHSIWDPRTVLTSGIWDHFLVVPSLQDPAAQPTDGEQRMLVIGSAAGTSKRAFAQLRPNVAMTSVELDAEVTAVGRRWFELEGEVVAADGRPFLAAADGETWDTIHVDAYRQPYIPFYLTTREFFELAASRLTDGGVFSINVGSSPEDPRINEAVAATMRDVFPYVARYRAEHYNEVIVAVQEPGLTDAELRARITAAIPAVEAAAGAAPTTEARELGALHRAFALGMHGVAPDSDKVLTDDRAPVEWMTDRMIFGEAN